MNICEFTADQAHKQPGRPAIVEGDRSLSYGELDMAAGRYAAELAARGVRPGDRVAVCLKEHTDHLLLLLAVMRLGAVIAIIDWRAPPGERQRIVAALGIVHALIEPEMSGFDGVPSIAIEDGFRRAAADRAPAPLYPAGPDDPAFIALSSGSTGLPKGALITHGQARHRFQRNTSCFGWQPEDRYLSCIPLCFSAARDFTLVQLTLGGTVVLAPPLFTAEEFCRRVERYAITACLLTATPLRWLLDLPQRTEPLLPGIRRLAASGAPLHAAEKAAVFRRITPGLIEAYGASAIGIITRLAGEEVLRHGESVGRPLPTVELELVDRADRPVAPGADGILRCRSSGMTAEIIGEEGDEEARSLRQGWYYPGDIGSLDGEGFLTLKGRSADLIIRGGSNIYPAEIERVLMTHPGVAEAAVVGWPSRLLGEEVAAFIRPRGALEIGELRALCLQQLVPYKVPRGFFLVDELPRTGPGKVRKSALVAGLTPL